MRLRVKLSNIRNKTVNKDRQTRAKTRKRWNIAAGFGSLSDRDTFIFGEVADHGAEFAIGFAGDLLA